jgi:hypothetical protein
VSRLLTPERQAQGFRSQEQLDAFYRYFDHTRSCAECQREGTGVWMDDGWQPTVNRCAIGLALDAAATAAK